MPPIPMRKGRQQKLLVEVVTLIAAKEGVPVVATTDVYDTLLAVAKKVGLKVTHDIHRDDLVATVLKYYAAV